jgi:outer membrane protein assembly factor BamB
VSVRGTIPTSWRLLIGATLGVACVAIVVWQSGTWSPTSGLQPVALPALLTALGLGVALVGGQRIALLRSTVLRSALIVAALLFTARFQLASGLVPGPGEAQRVVHHEPPAAHWEQVSFLRRMAAAQSQYRLRTRAFASVVDSLGPSLAPPEGQRLLSLSAKGDTGWSARTTLGGIECFIWVRDSTLRRGAWESEGVPTCGAYVDPRPNRQTRTVHATVGYGYADVSEDDARGQWLQHRGDAARTGIVSTGDLRGGPFRWKLRVGGEVLASVAVAGNQVFVGTHGNGELTALTLDSGHVSFRLRTPNWIHHEPVVTKDLVIVGFGNNEQPPGTPPSGVIAYDRRTGVERWRQLTGGGVMTPPALKDSTLVVVTFEGEALGMRVSDGTVLWKADLIRDMPDSKGVPMGNPLVLDSLVLIGLEPARLCALYLSTGAVRFCRDHTTSRWGGGHASVSAGAGLILQTFEEGVTVRDAVRAGDWLHAMAKVFALGISEQEQVLVGLDPATGVERWRLSLGVTSNRRPVAGHIAGTPVFVDGIAYVPSPISGRVFAVRADSGRVLWSTDVRTLRGSVLVTQGAVLAATQDTALVVLDAATGRVRCRLPLPGISDRAGPTLAGETAILTYRNGYVVAEPIADLLSCRGAAPRAAAANAD